MTLGVRRSDRMYDDILLPVDGTDNIAAVIEHAAAVADWADATLHILYVADTTRDSVTVVETGVVDALVEKGEDIVDDVHRALRGHGIDIETDVVQGNPAETIVEYANHYEMDLVLVSTQAKEGVSRVILGSVAEKIVRLSPVPVMTIRRREDEQIQFPYEDILVPTDGSDGATVAMEHAVSLAAGLDATLHGLSVIDEGILGLDVRSSQVSAEHESMAESALDDLAELASEAGVDAVERHLVEGDPGEQIIDHVGSTGADTVVMGTTGRRGADRILLGSVAESTVRRAPVPVFTVASHTETPDGGGQV